MLKYSSIPSFKAICNTLVLFVVGMSSYGQVTPTITAISTLSGPVGSQVTITGAGFNAVSASNTVFFGAVKATSLTATGSTTLTVTVPYGANYQYLSVTNLANSLTAYSMAPFVITFPSNGITDFNNDGTFTSSNYTKGVAIGDFNADGMPDLVVANADNGYVSIYRNTSIISGILAFTFVNTVSTGGSAYPQQISIIDLDGDGKLDFTVARTGARNNYTSGSDDIRLYRNTTSAGNTAITFTTGPVLVSSAGIAASGVNTADFDGDGKPDLVAITGLQNRVSIFRNLSLSGTITFTTTAQTFNFTGGATANFVAVGDLDQDGKPDLVVSTSANTLSIFHNQSTPGNINFLDTFASKIDLAIGFTAYGVAIGDFDGDSNPDIAVTDQTNGRVVFFRNTNNSNTGTISFPNIFSFAFATSGGIASTGNIPYTNLSIADFDGDGKIDVAATNESSGASTMLVLKNTSTGVGVLSFSNRIKYTTGETNAWNLVSGDLNADSRPDIIVSNFAGTTGRISLFRNVATVSNPPVITSVAPLSGIIGSTITINGQNFNANPLSNTVFFGSTAGTVQAGSTSTTLLVTVPYGANYQYISVTNLDTKLTAYSARPFVVTYPTAMGVFNQFAPGLSISGVGSPNQQVVKDFNGDGRPDIVVGAVGGFYILTNATQALSSAITFTAQPVIPIGNIRSLSADDLDGDGKPDLVLYVNNTVYIYKNSSTGSISFSNAGISTFSTGIGGNIFTVLINDVDGDSRPDIIMGGNAGSSFNVFRNMTTGGVISFSSVSGLPTGGAMYALVVGDIDGDGKPDLASANENGGNNFISLFRNTSTGPGIITFASYNYYYGGYYHSYGLSIGDVNGDNKLDLAVANYNTGNISVFRNTSTLGIIDGNSFATPIIYTPSVNPSSVAIGDINGDGQPDLVSTPYNGGSAASISVFRNINSSTSTINFSDRSDYPIPVSSNSVTGNFVSLVDFNGDGLLDIVTTNIGSNLSIFRNTQIGPTVFIADFTPKQGPVSTTVTIIGGGFNINPLRACLNFIQQ